MDFVILWTRHMLYYGLLTMLLWTKLWTIMDFVIMDYVGN